MLGNLMTHPLNFLFFIGALIVAITVHEFSHAFMADRLGDPTPRLQGRLTLNPLAHLDPLGTLLLFLVRFGWGKPVQFDPFNLSNPRRDAAIISLAGPASNIVTATVSSIALRALLVLSVPGLHVFGTIASGFLQQVIVLNIILAVFNLVPVHPLDGFKVVWGLLPPSQAQEWAQLERYGLIFLLFLLLPIFGGTAPILNLIGPVINWLLGVFIPA